jgi:hypothetical protein
LRVLLLACSFALAGYAGVRLLSGDRLGVTLWFVGAAVLHDLVFLPLYATVDRAVTGVLGAVGRRERTLYVRVPAALSGLLLLVWFPLISGRVADRYESATGLSADGFLARWAGARSISGRPVAAASSPCAAQRAGVPQQRRGAEPGPAERGFGGAPWGGTAHDADVGTLVHVRRDCLGDQQAAGQQ